MTCSGPIHHHAFPAPYHGQSQHVICIILFLYLEGERATVAGELAAWKRYSTVSMWRRLTCSPGLTYSQAHFSGPRGAPPLHEEDRGLASPSAPAAACEAP